MNFATFGTKLHSANAQNLSILSWFICEFGASYDVEKRNTHEIKSLREDYRGSDINSELDVIAGFV